MKTHLVSLLSQEPRGTHQFFGGGRGGLFSFKFVDVRLDMYNLKYKNL